MVYESLRGPAKASSSGALEMRQLLLTREPTSDAPGIVAEMFNGRPGRNPRLEFRDGRLLTAQLPLRLDPADEANREVIRAADVVTAALRGVFHVDPVPHLMRDYVSERDSGQVSDGMLRFVAVATALLTPNSALDVDRGLASSEPAAGVLLVIEELENGLHPSQAGRVLELTGPERPTRDLSRVQ